MKDKLLKVFKEAAASVLAEYGFDQVDIFDTKLNDTPPAFVSIIGLVGQVKGYFILQLCGSATLAMVKHMENYLGLVPGDEDRSRWCRSTVAEMANQIAGTAVVQLSEIGIDCMITPPTNLSGESIEASIPTSDFTKEITIKLPWGMIHSTLAIKNE